MKEFILDGNNFSDLEGFYTEIDKLMTKDMEEETGHNLDALNDILRGGFGVHEFEEEIIVKWLHYEKSKQDLGEAKMLAILEVFLDCDNSGHSCKLELFH